ncbi:hypothetical protein [Photobacterium leiognathi]|uniref:Uncharacterized protein n=1 Tax=Photobacterium leiognathi subsp. mandapamensis TaxID=48408 RepID=A0A2T3KPE4_PHOLD|nr:hypothetical protein [Photobacterium leiognathi]PSV05935.1 hypothetical protein C0W93_21035 [Photobacterium leiognathi subsp. mandapamensis]
MDEATLFNNMNNMVAIDGEADLSAFMYDMTSPLIIPDTQMSNDIPLDINPPMMSLKNDIPSEPFSIGLPAYQPMTLEWASGETLYAGFDTEYQHNAISGQNEIISYQVVGQTQRGQCSVIVYPKSGAKH